MEHNIQTSETFSQIPIGSLIKLTTEGFKCLDKFEKLIEDRKLVEDALRGSSDPAHSRDKSCDLRKIRGTTIYEHEFEESTARSGLEAFKFYHTEWSQASEQFSTDLNGVVIDPLAKLKDTFTDQFFNRREILETAEKRYKEARKQFQTKRTLFLKAKKLFEASALIYEAKIPDAVEYQQNMEVPTSPLVASRDSSFLSPVSLLSSVSKYFDQNPVEQAHILHEKCKIHHQRLVEALNQLHRAHDSLLTAITFRDAAIEEVPSYLPLYPLIMFL
jgi:hypothetical protein